MSALAGAPPIAPGAGGAPTAPAEKRGMSRGKKIFLALVAAWLGGVVFFVAVYGFKGHKAAEVASGALDRKSVV